jgi:hypothetical protein
VPILAAAGKPIPDEMIAPELSPVETTMIDAWGDLCGDRLTEFGSIPFTAIDRWAERAGVTDPDDFAFLVRAVRAADRVFMDWARKPKETHPPPPGDRR